VLVLNYKYYNHKEENIMEKVREVLYNSDTNRIFLKGFLGKVLFEIELVGDFILFEETFF
jgi:hypothetical protein